tara:strand:+ start:2439 stop:2816 length:378 start_codon:yes stop_codon:yes gene_type:complete
MPERVTKEERLVSRALEKARKVKELMNRENDTNITEKVIEIEIVENKKVKPTMADKIPNQTQKKEGYGLGGETTEHKIKKSDNQKYLRQMTDEKLDELRDISKELKYEKLEDLYDDLEDLTQKYD